jgi:hypothetical protein
VRHVVAAMLELPETLHGPGNFIVVAQHTLQQTRRVGEVLGNLGEHLEELHFLRD